MTSNTFSHHDYRVAWICALPLEMEAAMTMLDEIHAPLQQSATDHNVYTLGAITGHNVVIACPQFGTYGIPTPVPDLVTTFPNIQFGFIVGIGGGAPSKSADIRLGDIVVGEPTNTSPGVIQYDYTRTVPGRQLQWTSSLNEPPLALCEAVARIRGDNVGEQSLVSDIMDDALLQNGKRIERFLRPKNDWLFQPTYSHESDKPDCSACDQSQLVHRSERTPDEPHIHYGLIASGDLIIKDPVTRDSIAEDLGILCFDTLAAGLMDEFPSLVIRGICDYCDSHKNKDWQGYAALAAAAYTRILLSAIPVNRSENFDGIDEEQSRLLPRNPRFVGRRGNLDRLMESMFMPEGREAGKPILGPEHSDTLSRMHILASRYTRQGRLEEAEKLLIYMTEVREQTLGQNLRTLLQMDTLASIYMGQEQLDKAEKLLMHALETRKRVLGLEHPDTLSSMGNLASTYMRRERLDEAEKLLTHVTEASKRVFGLHHPITQASMSKEASVRKSQALLTQQEESSLAGTTLVGTQDEYVLGLKPSPLLDRAAADVFEDEDCISVVSNDVDIASQVATRRTELEIFAVRQFGTFLGELEELRSLHEEALKKLGAKCFQENYRRILKLYVLKLRDEARTAVEKDTVQLLKSRSNCTNIAQRILSLIQEDKENIIKPIDELTSQPVEKRLLEDWARNAYGSPILDTMINSGLEAYEPSSDGSDSEDHEEL